MASAPSDLVAALRKLVLELEADLRARVDGDDVDVRQDGVFEAWKHDYDKATAANRTEADWPKWRNDRVTQTAVAWVLLTVFARYCEDNALITPRWISGANADERAHALDARRAYFQTNPEDTDREWLTQISEHFAQYSATGGLVDRFSPMHLVAPSGDAARKLLEFWWQQNSTGEPLFSFAGVDTRFLGDVYQDLSEHAKKTYALLQTPEFVEEFILDQAMEPALANRPLDGFTVIDPTCGSGHFLLGAFHRLHERWQRHAPALGPRELVERALDGIYGVDINPFAVAIARFRLLVAALRAAGDTSLEQRIAYNPHLAAGDSLLWGANQQLLPDDLLASGPSVRADTTENADLLAEILQREHDVVVGNPPYIRPDDASLRQLYRDLYATARGPYALSAPFMELFFRLARSDDRERPAGWVGKITSNSFMTRGFGKTLVEKFLPSVDLVAVIDSEGAWIPGHNSDGTPTVIMIGRGATPSARKVRTVLSNGIRETRETVDSPYWLSIVNHLNQPGFSNTWISVVDLERPSLANHPWSLSGGGSFELLQELDRLPRRLKDVAPTVGLIATTRADEAYDLGEDTLARLGFSKELHRPFISGPRVRDWAVDTSNIGLCPYTDLGKAKTDSKVKQFLWAIKPQLENRKALSGTQVEQGREWWEYSQLSTKRFLSKRLVAFAEIASSNHFAMASGLQVYDRSAPVIDVQHLDDEHTFELLACLNSSVICFWQKRKCKPKGGTASLRWARTYQFNVTTMKNAPIPPGISGGHARALTELSSRLRRLHPAELLKLSAPSIELFETARVKYDTIRQAMFAHQEEIDWQSYAAFGIVDADLSHKGTLPGVRLGERAFEIFYCDNPEFSDWITSGNATPTDRIPEHFDQQYKEIILARMRMIESNASVRLLETPEFKRLWLVDDWSQLVTDALKDWLLRRLDSRHLWFDRDGRPTPQSIAQLADKLERDDTFISALDLWADNISSSSTSRLTALITNEHVPFLAVLRHTDIGLDKNASWDQFFERRRSSGAGDHPEPSIPIPEEFNSDDFRTNSYWKNRGRYNLPKERFISYPGLGRDSDPTYLLGWAGWDHADQALALAGLISQRIEDGWDTPELIPMFAGLNELLPWVRQWHNQIDPEYGESVADTVADELTTRLNEHRLTVTELTAWRPTPTRKPRTRKTS